MITWIKIKEGKNLPHKEVLTCNKKPKTHGYGECLIGYMNQDDDTGILCCSSENEILENITHYSELNLPV